MSASVARETPINTPRRCPCGQEDCRPGQRNGLACAAAANKRYRQRLADKRAIEHSLALEAIAQHAKDICA